MKSMASDTGQGDSYNAALTLSFGSSSQSAAHLTAFEENRYFVYALGTATVGLTRRLVISKPSTFVIEDRTARPSQDGMCLYSESAPSISAEGVRLTESGSEIFWESPQPQQVSYSTARQPGEGAGEYIVAATSPATAVAVPSLHVFHVLEKGRVESPVRARLVHAQDAWELSTPAGDRTMHLWLPFSSEEAGEIAISAAQGKALVERQPLPSGVLPHGPKGNRLLETWDADYRGPKPPAWDIGRPSDELRKVVSDGTVSKCRVVDLCCGSGTDAIFLASHGFDVTAVDVAPTALAQARQKADKAGVTVRWVLADVLNPPDLVPFDFLYDRGCYHVVRDQNLTAYLETLRRISHPGAQFLLLSARREEQAAPDAPGVTEEELRFDFLPLFDVEWLRQIRLESNETESSPPGWCVLMRRNSNP